MIDVTARSVFEVDETDSLSLAKIARFSKNPIGWRFGEGVPTTAKVTARARRLVKRAESLGWETDVFPGVSGELLIDVEQGDLHYEFVLEIDSSVSIIRVEGDVDVERLEGQTDHDAIERLLTVSSCVIYDYYILTSGSQKTTDSAGWHSAQPIARHLEFPLSIPNAQLSDQVQYAPISRPITVHAGHLPRYSGSLKLTSYARLAGWSILSDLEETSGAITTSTISATKLPTHSSRLIGAITHGPVIEYAPEGS